jgi:hypothetical protein
MENVDEATLSESASPRRWPADLILARTTPSRGADG